MIVNLRLLTGEILKVHVHTIEGVFVHRGTIIKSFDKVEENDWLLELPHTNCVW